MQTITCISNVNFAFCGRIVHKKSDILTRLTNTDTVECKQNSASIKCKTFVYKILHFESIKSLIYYMKCSQGLNTWVSYFISSHVILPRRLSMATMGPSFIECWLRAGVALGGIMTIDAQTWPYTSVSAHNDIEPVFQAWRPSYLYNEIPMRLRAHLYTDTIPTSHNTNKKCSYLERHDAHDVILLQKMGQFVII